MMSLFPSKQDSDGENSSRFLITGLGNPGRQYQSNRHNIGFAVLDSLAETLGTNFSRMESKALVAKTDHKSQRLILAKPQTYMNLSGQAVNSLLRFYKVPLDKLIVVYDEVDLDFGILRIRPSGGSAGHNGMNSIITQLGTQEFPRLRIGVGRPPGRMDAAAYVLQDFSQSEEAELALIRRQAVEALLSFVTQGIAAAMNAYNANLLGTDDD
jgi:PTH1 family peptidyl-tRNA hydrolase